MAKRADSLTALYREQIRALIAASGRSQQDIASKAGQTQPNVNRFLTGQMKYPPLDFLDALARVFSRRLTDLLTEGMPALPPSGARGPDEQELLDCYRTLDPAARKMLRDQAMYWADLSRRASSAQTHEPSAGSTVSPSPAGIRRQAKRGTRSA